MVLSYIATHHVFAWVAVALAVAGNALVWVFLERVFIANKPSWLPTHHDFVVYPRIQRAAHFGVIGVELKVVALVIAGVYVAFYPTTMGTALLVAYFAWLLAMVFLVMVGVSRVKHWWGR